MSKKWLLYEENSYLPEPDQSGLRIAVLNLQISLV